MKKLTRWAVCLGLCLALLVCGALAAESGISVQLDGAPLVFTDAVPQVKDQRTFLPFRAVFEAMDADVDYEGNTITAVRGDKTLTMTIGSTEATVAEKGVTTPISMDVAPYVDATTWRTYVPVRFAAQAFDCAVGWDQAAQTAVIVDTEKLVTEAMEGKTYTYLEQLAALGNQYKEGIWNMDAAFDMYMTMLTAPMMTMDGEVKGVMQDNAKMDMTMNMKMDMDGLMGMVGAMGAEQPDEAAQAQFEALKTDGVDLALRGDINAGKLYMNMDMSALGAAATEAGLDPDAWYELDMAALMEQAGMDWSELMAMSENSDLLNSLSASLSAAAPNSAATGYSELKTSFEELFAAFADESFQKDAIDTYVASYAPTEDSLVALNVAKAENQVIGYMLTVTGQQGEGDQLTTFQVTASQTAEGKLTAVIKVRPRAFDLTMTMEGSYTQGTTAPVVTPPAGAKVVPFTELMGQTGDLGVIGGQDGPTAIITAKAA